jgi:hypothetical protein
MEMVNPQFMPKAQIEPTLNPNPSNAISNFLETFVRAQNFLSFVFTLTQFINLPSIFPFPC